MKQFLLLFLFICSAQFSHAQGEVEEATLLGTWANDELVGSAAYDNAYNEIWGISRNGHEYAIIGSTAGTHFIDVTDTDNIFEAFFVEGAETGPVIIHRDYHEYGCYLYAACDEGNSTLQIIDFSNVPESIEVVYDDNLLMRQAHNIFIDSTQATLYLLAASGGDPGYSALRIYDITEPLNPVYIDEYNTFGGLSVGHVHDAYVRDGIGYLNCGGDGFAVVDFTDPANPVGLGTLTDYPHSGYNHSGWLSDDGDYYFMADETWGMDMKVVNVSDFNDISVETLFDSESEFATAIPHNQIVHCNYLYTSYYYEGLQVHDISDPVNPVRVLQYDTSTEPDGNNYKGAWGVYPFLPSGKILVSDMQEGLFVFEGIDPNCVGIENNASCQPSAIEQVELISSMEIFPNPSSGIFTVTFELEQLERNVNFSLQDISGKKVMDFGDYNLNAGSQQLELDTENIQAGFYFLTIKNNDLNVTQKIILN